MGIECRFGTGKAEYELPMQDETADGLSGSCRFVLNNGWNNVRQGSWKSNSRGLDTRVRMACRKHVDGPLMDPAL
jgi:hypothetical protein